MINNITFYLEDHEANAGETVTFNIYIYAFNCTVY